MTMAGRTSIIIQGTAWGVQETKNGKRFLRVSVSPGYRDRNGNWVSQPEQNYSVWPAGYANLNPVFDQIAQLRRNQDTYVDVTIVGEVNGFHGYQTKQGESAASCNVNAAPSPSPTCARRTADSRVTARRPVTRSSRRGRRSLRPPTHGPVIRASDAAFVSR